MHDACYIEYHDGNHSQLICNLSIISRVAIHRNFSAHSAKRFSRFVYILCQLSAINRVSLTQLSDVRLKTVKNRNSMDFFVFGFN